MERSLDELNVNIHDIAGLLSFLRFDGSSRFSGTDRDETRLADVVTKLKFSAEGRMRRI
jgi:hypothetical protein